MTIMTSVAEDGNDAQEHFGKKKTPRMNGPFVVSGQLLWWWWPICSVLAAYPGSFTITPWRPPANASPP